MKALSVVRALLLVAGIACLRPAGADAPGLNAFGGRLLSVPWTNRSPTAPRLVDWRLWISSGGLAVTVATGSVPVASGAGLRVEMPPISRRTGAVLAWKEAGGETLKAVVTLYPTNLLDPLRLLATGSPIAVVDASERLSAELSRRGIPAEAWDSAHRPPLLVVDSSERAGSELRFRLKAASADGVPVVWFRPAPLEPDHFAVPAGSNRILVAAAPDWGRLDDDPIAVLRLVRIIDLARGRADFQLPEDSP